MNLLQIIRQEVKEFNLNDKLEIARYIYIRLGTIFEYDPFYAFATDEEREVIKNGMIDPENITNFYYVGFGWAPLYVSLLYSFNIPARVIRTDQHAYVQYFLHGKTFLADVTNENEDIMRIKFHLPTIYNRQIAPTVPRIDNSFLTIDSKFYECATTQAMINELKAYLLQQKKYLSEERYIYYVFKSIEKFVNQFQFGNIGVVSGTQFIDYLLDQFIGKNIGITCKRFFNVKNKNCFQVYLLKVNYQDFYFAYEKDENGIFHLNEKTNKVLAMPEKESVLILKFTSNNSNSFIKNKHHIA